MSAEDGDDLRKGGGDYERGIDGIIEEERNGRRDVGVPAAVWGGL